MYYKPQKVREQYCNSQCNSSKNILNTGNDSSELDENWLKKKFHLIITIQMSSRYKICINAMNFHMLSIYY